MNLRTIGRFGAQEISTLRQKCLLYPSQIIPISGDIPKIDLSETRKRAAVLIPLCNFKGSLSVIFTLRSATVGTHRSQVSFPGGHINEGESDVEAAIRETREELGANIGPIEILGQCQLVHATTGTIVTPVLGFLSEEFTDYSLFEPNASEVDRVFIRSLDQLMDPSCNTTEQYQRNGKTTTLPVFGPNEGVERIWGLTALILKGVLRHILMDFPKT